MDHAHHHAAEAVDAGMDMCSMNMLFTWNTKNLCIVFRSWHVRSTTGLVVSLLAVVALGAGYEALRAAIRSYQTAVARRLAAAPSAALPPPSYADDPEATPAETATRTGHAQPDAGKRAHLIKSALYGVQNFYAFMIMLVFMTYNGWVMLAVSFGAFLGYYVFGADTEAIKETACH